MTKFNELGVGDTFDFVNPDRMKRMLNSFFERCEKISPCKYRSLQSFIEYEVGRVGAEVFHVRKKD